MLRVLLAEDDADSAASLHILLRQWATMYFTKPIDVEQLQALLDSIAGRQSGPKPA